MSKLLETLQRLKDNESARGDFLCGVMSIFDLSGSYLLESPIRRAKIVDIDVNVAISQNPRKNDAFIDIQAINKDIYTISQDAASLGLK